jgi:hypothetical protein
MPVAAKSFFIMAYDLWRAMGRVWTPKPSGVERRGPEPCNMRQPRSPPPRRDEVQSRETRGSVGAHLCREAGSRVVGYAVVLEPT